jgi:hypothetical protein
VGSGATGFGIHSGTGRGKLQQVLISGNNFNFTSTGQVGIEWNRLLINGVIDGNHFWTNSGAPIAIRDSATSADNFGLHIGSNKFDGVIPWSLFGGVIVTGGGNNIVATLTDGAMVTLDASQGNIETLAAGGSRTMANPINLLDGQFVTVDLLNNTGAGIVTTWAATWRLAGAWVDPAAGKRRLITFYCYDGTNAREVSRTAADQQ